MGACGSCGAVCEEGYSFCDSCGAPRILKSQKSCACGQALDAGVSFCSGCGQKTVTNIQTNSVAVKMQEIERLGQGREAEQREKEQSSKIDQAQESGMIHGAVALTRACMNCGEALESSSVIFCPECGTKQDLGTAAPSESSPSVSSFSGASIHDPYRHHPPAPPLDSTTSSPVLVSGRSQVAYPDSFI